MERPNDYQRHKEDSFASFDLKVPGNTPYRKYGKNVLFPKADVSLCTECSACAKICPAGAISLDNPKKTDHDKCIGCMKCVRFCKQKARYVSAFKLNMAAKKLTKVCQSDKKAAYRLRKRIAESGFTAGSGDS